MMQHFKARSGYEWTPFYEVRSPHKRGGLRERLEAEIDRLIQLLDELDGDADFEPSLSGVGQMRGDMFVDDLEGDEAEGEGNPRPLSLNIEELT